MTNGSQKELQRKPMRLFTINVIGTTAAIISAISLLPQLFNVIETNNVDGISLSTLLLIFTTSLLWLIYHIMMGTYHGSVSSSFNLLFATALIYLVIKIRGKEDASGDERMPLNK